MGRECDQTTKKGKVDIYGFSLGWNITTYAQNSLDHHVSIIAHVVVRNTWKAL